MDDRNNTIAGWVLAGCGAALGLSIVGGMLFEGHRPEKMGYPIEGVADDSGGGAAPEVAIETLLPTADPTKGQQIFQKCAACHTNTQGGPNGIGPNLYGVVGDNIAQGRGGFAFSDALKAVGGKWDFDKLNTWLTNPRKFAPGTKMTFAGLGSAQDRANVIVYLNAQGSNVPLPKAAPAAAPTGSASAGGSPADKAKPTTDDLANKGAPASGAPSQDLKATTK